MLAFRSMLSLTLSIIFFLINWSSNSIVIVFDSIGEEEKKKIFFFKVRKKNLDLPVFQEQLDF
ncbi:hypothetical protein HanIR_Chr04g0153461 [Helianthus annuus]|nr:hypothetical protein HanIR_Chr04g0153461 [Helianthus annuus]